MKNIKAGGIYVGSALSLCVIGFDIVGICVLGYAVYADKVTLN